MSFSHTFESGWAFSVVEWGMGAEDGLLEIAIKKDGEWHFDNPIGTWGYLTEKEVETFINLISTWKPDEWETFDDNWEENHSALIEAMDTIQSRWEDEE